MMLPTPSLLANTTQHLCREHSKYYK